MKEIVLKAHGKINLMLDVTGKRTDGYHDIKTIMQSVDLSDNVTVKKISRGDVEIKTNFDDFVKKEDNIALKAAMLMKRIYGIKSGFKIEIEKNIPLSGGMGGGSTDAAAVIKAINELCGLNLTEKQMMETGLMIGADVPFCIYERCALATGVGEILTPIDGLKNCTIAIVNPKKFVSTAVVYKEVDKCREYGEIDEKYAVNVLKEERTEEYGRAFLNVMQDITIKICPEIKEIIEKLKSMGAVCAAMSGSGPTCFGIFAKNIGEHELKKNFPAYFAVLSKPI